jgi:hypothetical protein
MKRILLSVFLAAAMCFAPLSGTIPSAHAAAACYTYSTNGQSTLNGAINNSTTTIIVASASSFPSISGGSGCFFHIKVDSEIIKITATSGATFTGVRAAQGTSAASHSSGATATEVVTAADLDQLKLDANIPGISTNSSRSVLSSDFTLNAADSVFQDTGVSLSLPAAGTYFISCSVNMTFVINGGTYVAGQIKLYNSTDAADVSGTLTLTYTSVTNTFIDNLVIATIYAPAAAKTIKLYANRQFDGSAPLTSKVGGGFGLTTCLFIKLAN